MKFLMVTADDFAMSPMVNDGIVALAEAGRLTGTSCMTLSPHWPASAKRLTPTIQQHCAIGLHLDFTAFGESLIGLPALICQAYGQWLSRTKLTHSIQEQLDRFEDALGRRPDYIDGHQHVHQLPMIRDALVQVLTTRWPAHERPWLRISQVVSPENRKGKIITLLGAQALRRMATQAGLVCSQGLLGVYGFEDDHASLAMRMQNWLALAQTGDVLMCHPAAQATPHDPVGHARVTEFNMLNGADWPQWLARHGLTLAHHAQALQALGLPRP